MPTPLFIARIAEATGQTPETLSGAKVTGKQDDDAESDPAMDLFDVIRRIVRAEVRSAA